MQVYKYRSALPKDKLSKSSPPEDFLFRRQPPYPKDFLFIRKTFSLSEDYLFSEDYLLLKATLFTPPTYPPQSGDKSNKGGYD